MAHVTLDFHERSGGTSLRLDLQNVNEHTSYVLLVSGEMDTPQTPAQWMQLTSRVLQANPIGDAAYSVPSVMPGAWTLFVMGDPEHGKTPAFRQIIHVAEQAEQTVIVALPSPMPVIDNPY